MCGIAGRFNFRSGAPVDQAVIADMCALLAHRGPDGQGVFARGAIGLGHRRLSIIDLSDAGRQPMTTGDERFWITFNGEIYNFLELRKDFERRGHRFQSHTDTEVILAAYREYGVACLEHLRGMFAFAIWDAQERTLLLARDRAGKKPLYYRVDQDGISFASEPKAFLAEPGFEMQPNLGALSHYLSYQYVPTPASAFQGVERLRPAHYVLINGSDVSPKRYWTLRYEPKQGISEADACDELLARLREATRLRLISDVPLGAFLSGGVDSSAIVALMSELGSGPVKTFSIGFDEQGFDELEYARLVARRYGTEHHEFVVTPDAVEIFPKLVWHYNEPFADSSAIPTYYLSQLTRQHVTVALNGDAGDENFAGYDRYAPSGMRARYERMPNAFRQALASVVRRLPARAGGVSTWARGKRMIERGALSPAMRYAIDMMQFEPSLRGEICTPEFTRAAGVDDPTALVASEVDGADATEFLDRMLSADVNRYLPDALLVKVDIATMAHGLEGRSPLLDHHVMEFAATLPADFKRRGATSKYIFKRAIRHLVPADILDRPKKGFSVPLAHWFRNDLREMASDVLLDSRTAARGYFRPAVIRRLLDEHVRGVRNWHEQLWNLLMLEMWHRTFVDGRSAVAKSAAAARVVEPPEPVRRVV
jgi:asparagine synthase (glutamine-hydrolysing)